MNRALAALTSSPSKQGRFLNATSKEGSMSAISSLAALALLVVPGGATAPSSPPAVVLAQFSSQQCTHCRAMEPTMARLAQQGCAVQTIDVDQDPDIARQFGVTGVPTYVAMATGRETGRVVGATTYERLLD